MPIRVEDIERSEDSPELTAFKKKVIETTRDYVRRHGHDRAADTALKELGLLDPGSLPVVADVNLKVKINLTGIQADTLKDRTQEEINAMLAEKITGSIRKNGTIMEMVGRQVKFDDNNAVAITVEDANLNI